MPFDMLESDTIAFASMVQQRQHVNYEVLVLDRFIGDGSKTSCKPFREIVYA